MAIIARTIQNTTSTQVNITLQVPGYNTEKPAIVIPFGTTLDLFTVLTGDQLEAIQTTLAQYISLGQISVTATVDTATFNPVGGSSGVSSVHSDSNPLLTGAVQLVSGTHITLSQTGQAITVNATGELSQTLTNSHIFVGNVSNIATDVAMSGDVSISNAGATALSTVNSNVGSFTSANITVDAKGRITAAANGSGGGGSFTPAAIAALPNTFITTSTTPVDTGLDLSYALADASHQALISISGIMRSGDGSNQSPILYLFVDGVNVIPGASAIANTDISTGSADHVPVGYTYLYSPGDTASHAYAVYLASDSGGSVEFGVGYYATLVISDVI